MAAIAQGKTGAARGASRRSVGSGRLARYLPALLSGFILCNSMPAQAADEGQSELEYQIKAAYIHKFAAHIDWPAAAFPPPGMPVTIGVIGADAMAAELDKIKSGHAIQGRAVEVKRLKPGEPAAGIQILFVGEHDGARLKRTLDSFQAQPVLTITEGSGALGAGSIINFVSAERRIRFELSILRAESSGLKISARLLAVAQRIEGGKP